MKTLDEMRALGANRQAELLTLEKAKQLKGKRIQTIYFGYRGQDHTDEFVVGDIVSEYDYYKNLKEEGGYLAEHGFKNRAEYWESYMTQKQLDATKNKIMLLKDDGTLTYMSIGIDKETFTCTDEDRFVRYIMAE